MPEDLRVLILEDSEDDALLLIRELKKGDYNPLFERVQDREAMLRALRDREWDIVISDYVMPQFTGLAALKVMRGTGIDLPFIIVSGNIGEDIAVEAMRAGAHDYIVKGSYGRLIPAVKRELAEVVQRRQRKWAEEALRTQGELLRRVMDNVPQAVAWKNAKLVYEGCNLNYALMVGVESPAEIVGKTDEQLPRTLGAAAILAEREARVMLENTPDLHVSEEVTLGDGAKRCFDRSRVPLQDAEGRVVGLLSVSDDITERKQAEEDLREGRERELRIQVEAEETKREFYRSTILAVTDGKLNVVEKEEIERLIVPDASLIQLTGAEELSELRSEIKAACERAGVGEDDCYWLITAAVEAAANAVKHATGGIARVGLREGRVQVCIVDRGHGMDELVLPRATLMRYSTTRSMGLGYSLILSLVDAVYLATDKSGTWVMMEKGSQSGEADLTLEAFPDSW